MKHLTARRVFITATLAAALVATSASANQQTYNNNTNRTAAERGSTVSCNGFNDHSTSNNVIQKGGQEPRRAIGEPLPNSSCYPNYSMSTYAPAARYDADGNLIRYER